METRARHIIMGFFVLAVIGAGFAFVYWLHNTGGLTERATYRIRFENSVAGLRVGSFVLFNGTRVGEVTRLQFAPDEPKVVMATIVIDRKTPVRTDTSVGVEVQGLMGSPSISLKGGAPASPPLMSTTGETPVLHADSASTQDTMQVARDVLRRIDQVVAENSEPLRSTIGNLNTFSGALARNSDRLDKIVDGLVRLTGGGAEKPLLTGYDLTAPSSFPPIDKTSATQLVVPEPTALLALDTQRILARSNGGQAPVFADARWSDNLPKLVQAKVIQSLENANFMQVSRPFEGIPADNQLHIDIRTFRISSPPDLTAEVEFGAKLLGKNGRILETRVFRAVAPVEAMNAHAAASALDLAFGKAVTELVLWTAETVASAGNGRDVGRGSRTP